MSRLNAVPEKYFLLVSLSSQLNVHMQYWWHFQQVHDQIISDAITCMFFFQTAVCIYFHLVFLVVFLFVYFFSWISCITQVPCHEKFVCREMNHTKIFKMDLFGDESHVAGYYMPEVSNSPLHCLRYHSKYTIEYHQNIFFSLEHLFSCWH